MAISLKRAFKSFIYDRNQFWDSIVCNFLSFLPDKLYLSMRFRFNMGYWMNWKRPTTFSEKLQWLKVYNRRPEYTNLVDKYLVKEYVANKIGKEYVIPTYGVWENVDEINWDVLPKEFVLKTTHGGGSNDVVICKDKSNFDRKNAFKKLNESMNTDIYSNFREWPYKNVKKRIIAEELLHNSSNSDLPDYKFFCFNGQPVYCQVIAGRSEVMTVDFYNKDWEHQSFHEPKSTIFSPIKHDAPSQLKLMWDLATQLSQGHVFIRVDFYEVNNRVYFGELTFFPTSGFGGFEPVVWDDYFGSLINLN
jgi:hypothetical protein